MRYIITTIANAYMAGIPEIGHITKGNKIVINEKELMNSSVAGTFDERVEAIKGDVYTNKEIKNIIKKQRYG